ncbi:polysaccharide deacetylase family protein [Runella slithyformis]|uniref:Polysaccharide deacetylase n=1 Tax=Runella slithyformis (strain ATCC 29530 / DSM 19594 / LMG 11500 / NCIMB 11436 / LSU 4) TaxID=761193 RepID=A0A7U3ZG55_RUNSL|nr:polysaccharide deacetylase family protein [Runella slithyformis]AEI46620.1 polysaccharide deacetylase [Runella slithyformis DSM 19594]
MLLVIIGLSVPAVLTFLLLRKTGQKIRILMYHKVDPHHRDMLTVTSEQLETHLDYLQKQGYEFLRTQHLSNRSLSVSKGVLITFDDAYVNNLEYAYPVLKKYNARATLFVPSGYAGQSSQWDIKAEPLLSPEQLRQLDTDVFELGLHSHTHRHYGKLTAAEIEEDLRQNIRFFNQHRLPFVPVFAYPYGGRPKDKSVKRQMQHTMATLGITFAFRIGNRLNRFPFSDPYEIQRIDIRGTDTLEDFARKVKWGKQF